MIPSEPIVVDDMPYCLRRKDACVQQLHHLALLSVDFHTYKYNNKVTPGKE